MDIVEKIYRSGLRLLIPLSVEKTFDVIIKEVIRLTGARYGSIFLNVNGSLERVYASNKALFDIKIRPQGITHTVFKTGKPRILDSEYIKKIHPEYKKITATSDIIFPLINNKKTIGVISLQSHHGQIFSNKHLNILKLFTPLASLAIRNNQLYEELGQALDTRDLFISMASHELKTPLTTINGYVQLLEKKYHKQKTKESRWINELSWETYRLTELVKELLTINQIKSGVLTYHFKKCKISQIVDRAIKNFKFSFPKMTVDITNNSDIDIVWGDFDKLLQMFTNLLENAAKYSGNSKKVEILITSDKDKILIDIKDYGIGFETKDKGKIFEEYYRGTNHTREGMGLGLFLIRNIVEKHDAKITIKSKEDKGTTVTVVLPIYKS